jgi:hypothetical protein
MRSALAKFALPFLLILAFTLGLLLRLADLSNPPLDFHPTRQFFGAIRARALYQQTAPDTPPWQRDLSERFLAREAQLEPLILEHLTAFLYRWTGETPAVGRALSGLFWIAGGFFLYLLTVNLTASPIAALAALLFYLFLPYGVDASRSFQPDPLMVLFLLAFWWAFDHWIQQPEDWRWAILAGLAGGLDIYIKLTAVFFVVGGAIGLSLARSQFLPVLRRPTTWLVILLGVLPGGLYLYDGLFGRGFLRGAFRGRTIVSWWFSPTFYLRWLDKLDNVIPLLFLALTAVSLLAFVSRPMRRFLLSLWLFYFLFGLLQTYHIASHDYYSLPLIPITAIGLAPLASAFVEQALARLPGKPHRATFFAILVLFLLFFTTQEYLTLRRRDNRPLAQMYAEIGETLQHQPGVVALTADYGYPLFYYGWQNVILWKTSPDEDIPQAFAAQTRQKSYFLVTDLAELAHQPALQEQLNKYNILVQKPGYIIYDLRHPLP